jgi:hypothetical protein
MEQPHGQQAAEALHYQVIQSGYGRDNRTSTQDRCVAMQTISTMTNGRTGDDADRRGSGGAGRTAGHCQGQVGGRYKGRVPTARRQAAEIALRADGVTPSEIAIRLEVGRASINRVLSGGGGVAA